MKSNINLGLQVGLGLEDLLRKFVCSETVDAVECQGCGQSGDTNQPTAVRTKFIKRLTLGKVTLVITFLFI